MKLILYMVMSMDGIVALSESTDISCYSSEEDHIFFLREANACDAALMGRFSYNREVKARKYLLTHSPEHVETDGDTVILEGSAENIISRLKKDGCKKVALLGGPRTNRLFLEDDLVDEMYLTIEPVILGKGCRFYDAGIKDSWRLESSRRLNEKGTVVLHYVKKLSASSFSGDRWNNILGNERFLDIVRGIEKKERDRRFCGHGLDHLLDTSRIMQIMNLEEGTGLSRDMIYAAGLLHDIGRLREYEDGIPHEKAAEPLAREILSKCGYSEQEQEEIVSAISSHRSCSKTGAAQLLSKLLQRADKNARACFMCEAYKECNWPDEKKNKEMRY